MTEPYLPHASSNGDAAGMKTMLAGNAICSPSSDKWPISCFISAMVKAIWMQRLGEG